MLNQEQIDELFEGIKRRHEISDIRNIDLMRSGKDLPPEEIRDLSDEFDIDIDTLRGFDTVKISLLIIESASRLKLEEMPFDEREAIEKWHADIMKSGDILKFLRNKRKKPDEPPQLPPEAGGRGQ